MMVSVPWAGDVCAVTVSAEPPSLARSVVPVLGVLAGVVNASLAATGVTVRFTVAVES